MIIHQLFSLDHLLQREWNGGKRTSRPVVNAHNGSDFHWGRRATLRLSQTFRLVWDSTHEGTFQDARYRSTIARRWSGRGRTVVHIMDVTLAFRTGPWPLTFGPLIFSRQASLRLVYCCWCLRKVKLDSSRLDRVVMIPNPLRRKASLEVIQSTYHVRFLVSFRTRQVPSLSRKWFLQPGPCRLTCILGTHLTQLSIGTASRVWFII